MEFNLQCLVTKQTISEGHRVLVVPIRREATKHELSLLSSPQPAVRRRSHPRASGALQHLWCPIGPVLEAQYDGLGEFGLLETPMNRINLVDYFEQVYQRAPAAKGVRRDGFSFQEFLQRNAQFKPGLTQLLVQPAAEPLGVDDPSLWGEMHHAWFHIWQAADEREVFLADAQGVFEPLDFAVIHAAAVPALVEHYSAWNPSYRKPATRYMRDVFDLALTQLAADKAQPGAIAEFWTKLEQPANCTVQLRAATKQKLIEGYVAGRRTANGLFTLIEPWLTAVWALGGVQALCLPLSPIVQVWDDFDNGVGAAYAALTARVSAEVSAQRGDKA